MKHIGIIIVILLLVIIGILGYTQQHAMKSLFSRTSSTMTPVLTSMPSNNKAIPTSLPSTTTLSQENAIKDWVIKFYSLWLTGSYRNNVNQLVAQGYLTPNAGKVIINANGYNLPTCSQNPLSPNMYAYSIPTIKGDAANMYLTGSYSGGQTSTIGVFLVKVGSVWSINSFGCPVNDDKNW